jgi:hypothetical protein
MKRALGAVAAAAVAMGLVVLVAGEGGNGPDRPDPSVERFAFPVVEPAGPTVEPPAAAQAVAPPEEPADAVAAVTAVLHAVADGQPERAHGLLDAAGRARHPTPQAWARSRLDRAVPTSFAVAGTAPAPAPAAAGAVDVTVTVDHRPSLDPFLGLVPGRSEQVWRASPEAGGWRVGADPVATRFLLPPDEGAAEAVAAWVGAQAACDADAARALHAVDPLHGPADLAGAGCVGGDWTVPMVGPPRGLDHLPDPATLLAAYGPSAGTWARVVSVTRGGGGDGLLVAVAPLGDAWRLIGVFPGEP